jgi:conjugative relaxase-like TrwC/TraI family protein
MREMELEAKTRVRKHGQEADRTTGNLAWATFIHKTARPVNGEPDPHVHAHAFVLNTTWDQKEQAWKAGQFRDVKRDAPYFQSAFHARMAWRMRQLGYRIRRSGKNWDIVNIPRSMSGKFSRRTDQIEELARELDVQSDAEKSELGAKTRERKKSGLSMSELRTRWEQRLDDAEQQAITELPRSTDPVREIIPDRVDESASLAHATEHCFERHSVVPMKCCWPKLCDMVLATSVSKGCTGSWMKSM